MLLLGVGFEIRVDLCRKLRRHIDAQECSPTIRARSYASPQDEIITLALSKALKAKERIHRIPLVERIALFA